MQLVFIIATTTIVEFTYGDRKKKVYDLFSEVFWAI